MITHALVWITYTSYHALTYFSEWRKNEEQWRYQDLQLIVNLGKLLKLPKLFPHLKHSLMTEGAPECCFKDYMK